jgi:Spy/CpxP family protein refolding chaperone
MGDVVNLNQFRKERERRRNAVQAAVNRERFGRNKAEKERERDEITRAERMLDGAKRELSPDSEAPE